MSTVLSIESAHQAGIIAGELVTGSAVRSIEFAIAYEPASRLVVIDGSMLSPSHRAVDGAESIFQASYERPELWEAFTEGLDSIVNAWSYEDGSSDDAPPSWCLFWDDGMLVAESSDHQDDSEL